MNQENEVLAAQLRKHQTAHTELTDTQIAKALGISPSALSQWIGGYYQGDVQKINRAVRKYLEREQEKTTSPKTIIPFIETSVSMKIFEMAQMCHIYGEMGVAWGISGLGKTWAAREYTQENPGTILIEVGPHCSLSRSFMLALHESLNLSGKGTIDQLFSSLKKKLENSGRLLILDEAENLPYKTLELVRRLHDFTGIGVLMIGMPQLVINLQGRHRDYAQLYSRVTFATRLDTLKPVDTEHIVEYLLPNANGLGKVFHQESMGNIRILTKLLIRSNAASQINGIEIDADIVRRAKNSLILKEV